MSQPVSESASESANEQGTESASSECVTSDLCTDFTVQVEAFGSGRCIPCAQGCLYDIFEDPTEHINLKAAMPALWSSMLARLLAQGKTVYQTDYAEPGTESCFTGAQAARYYVGHQTCIEGGPGYHPSLPTCNSSTPRKYLGPMCFHQIPAIP